MPQEPRTPRTPARTVLVALVVLLAGAHLLVVTSAGMPPNRYSEATRPATGYLGSFFAQNWRLFAPNPVSSDRSIRFQGAFEDEEGGLVTTDWVDWTDVELDLVRHRLVGGRAGYVTNKAHSPTGARWAQVDTDQRKVADVVDPAEAPDWRELRTGMLAESDDRVDDRQVESWLLYDRALTRLGTQVLAARHPDVELVAVRYALRSQRVTPWAARGGTAKEREAARPIERQRVNGWRRPLTGDRAEQETVADFDRRHR